LNCVNGATCVTCALGLTDDGSGNCNCINDCVTCSGASSGSCTVCSSLGPPPVCSSCSAGYYFDGVSACPSCSLPGCSTCVYNATPAVQCTGCTYPYILSVNASCICNFTAGLYMAANGTCNNCEVSFLNCSSCTLYYGVSTCLSCIPGSYIVNSTTCGPCDRSTASNCLTCFGSASACTSCLPTYT
jgi:hypothetical protein